MEQEAQGDVAALVPAAGQGTRLGGTRKQFRLLGEEPLLVQTLRVFARHPLVVAVVVAVPEGQREAVQDHLQETRLAKPVLVVAGGATRQASVGAALRAVPEATALVLVHDAVRPFIRPEQVTEVIQAARVEGAAALAVPVTDTVRRGANSHFGETVPRRGLYRMQTPQAFRRPLFERAHAAAAASDVQATDDVDLVQRLGHPVRIVPGSPRNMKITTPDDWELAQWLWPHWSERFSV